MHENTEKKAFFEREGRNGYGNKIFAEKPSFSEEANKNFQNENKFLETHGSAANIQGGIEWWCFREASNDNLLFLPDESDSKRYASRSQKQVDEVFADKKSDVISLTKSAASDNNIDSYRGDLSCYGSSIQEPKNGQSISDPLLYISKQNDRECFAKEPVSVERRMNAHEVRLRRRSSGNSVILSSRVPKWKTLSNIHLKQSEKCKMDMSRNEGFDNSDDCERNHTAIKCRRSKFSLRHYVTNPCKKCKKNRKMNETRTRGKNIPEKQETTVVERTESKRTAHFERSCSTKNRSYFPFNYCNKIRNHDRFPSFRKNRTPKLAAQCRNLILARENDMQEAEFFYPRDPYNLNETTEAVQITNKTLPDRQKLSKSWNCEGEWCSRPQGIRANKEASGSYDGLWPKSSVRLCSSPNFCLTVDEGAFVHDESKVITHLLKKDEAEISSIFEESNKNDDDKLNKIDPLETYETVSTEHMAFVSRTLEERIDECKSKGKTETFDYRNLAKRRSDKLPFARNESHTNEFFEGCQGENVPQEVEQLQYVQRRIIDSAKIAKRALANKNSSYRTKSGELQGVRLLQKVEELEDIKPRHADGTTIRKAAQAAENSGYPVEGIIRKEIELAGTFRNNHGKGDNIHCALGSIARPIADVDEVVKDRWNCSEVRKDFALSAGTGVGPEKLGEECRRKRSELQTDCIFVRGYNWRWQRRIADTEKRRVIREYSLSRAYWSAEPFEIYDAFITWQSPPTQRNESGYRRRIATLYLYTHGRYDPYSHRLRLLVSDELGKCVMELSDCSSCVENVSYAKTVQQQLALLIFTVHLPVDFSTRKGLIQVEYKCDSRTANICLICFSAEEGYATVGK